MAKIQTPDPSDKILKTTLSLIEDGMKWNQVKIDDIALKSGLSKTDVRQIFTDEKDIFIALLKHLDHMVESETDHHLFKENPRDRLFEVLMLRFDALNKHPIAWRHLFYQTFKDPLLFRAALPQFHNSMDVMLRIADLGGRDGRCVAPLRTGAIAIVYLNAVRVWLHDTTPDMSKTMAELDRGLNRLESIMGYIPAPLKDFI